MRAIIVKMMKPVFVLGVLLLIRLTSSSECHGKPDPNAKPNSNPIQPALPRPINSTKNGKLYMVGKGDDEIPVVHVWGTPYEMGYAHGTLMKDKVKGFLNDVWAYMELVVVESVNNSVTVNIPEWFLQDVANMGLEAALDYEIDVTSKFSGSYFLEEIRGLADTSGLHYKKIQRIHLLGELMKGGCSMFGADKTATATGGLLQLRALDWSINGPFKNYPQITVYHPNEGNGHDFVNVGWTGWIGSITGMSSVKMAISEIGVTFPDDTFGKESRFGIPFTYLLRDILQYDATLSDSVSRIAHAHRTCDLILGVGDGKIDSFRGVEYSKSVANFFTPENLQPVADWHPRIPGIVYWGEDWLCPPFSAVLAKQLQKYHGNLTADLVIHDILPIVQTGNLHIAVYDLVLDMMYVSNARGDQETGPVMAYDRSFVKLDMQTIFSEKPPIA